MSNGAFVSRRGDGGASRDSAGFLSFALRLAEPNRVIGRFDTQEQAAHAVNAAIRRAGLEGRRKTNPVVDGQLVPMTRKLRGSA